MPGHLQEGFGCVVTNRFDQLLDDESDPFEILKAAENKKKEGGAAGSTKTAAQAAKQPKKESQKDRKNPLLDKKEETQAPVPLKKEGIRRVGRRPDQQGQSGPQHQGGQSEARPGDKRPERRPPRERRFEKPAEDKPEGGAEIPSDNSNPKTEEKRSGGGSHNWGSVKDEISEAEQTAAPEPTPEGEDNAPASSENKENEVEEVKSEGPKEMTLDEWKAMQDKERTKVEFNIRKPNEGADSQWKKGYVLHKSKSEDRPVGALIDGSEPEAEAHALYHKQQAPTDESADHHFRKPANDITSQLEINFGDLGRPGRGRGGARGGRGGRGGGGGGSRTARGGGRSEKVKALQRLPKDGAQASGASVPNVDDPEAFPALA
ncbi:SERPINE1 mRNA-binding protein 1 isoform X4 [Nothobranchius furzeri]|uniref:SERPINE1 mRNA-binding protein 1 isoform X4 n=1 Tax=Nothobranchius furzeri TaxID=105023 RepID=UPI003904D287